MKDVANAVKTANTERKPYNRKNHNQDDNIMIPNFPLYNKTFFDVKEIFKKYLTFTTESELQERIENTASLYEQVKMTSEQHRNMVLQFLYARHKIEEMWKDEKSHNFIKHLFVAFANPDKCTTNKINEAQTGNVKKCSVTGFICISSEEMKEAYEVWENLYTTLNLATVPVNKMPSKMFKYMWVSTNIDTVAVYSSISNRVISYATCSALRSYLKELCEHFNPEALQIIKWMMQEKGHLPYSGNKKNQKPYRVHMSKIEDSENGNVLASLKEKMLKETEN